MEIFLQIHDRGVFSSLSMGKDGPFASFVLRLGRGVPLSEGAVLRAASSAARVRGPPIGPPSRCGSRYPAISDGGVLAEMEEARVGRFALRGEEARCMRRRVALQRGG